MSGVIGIAGVLAILLGLGLLVGLARRGRFAPRWLAVALLLVAANDAALTLGYGWMPDWIGGVWNWQGKLLALAVTLGVAAMPAFGWRASGFTLAQRPGSLRAALPVGVLYCLLFVGLALAFPSDPADGETVGFQLTMPGLDEELFYRGLLLLAFDRAFPGRVRVLGVDWGWGALLSSVAFGLAHAFSYGRHGFALDPLTMALTAVPALLAVWLRLRTGSVAVPVIVHNFGNAIGLLV